MNQVNDRHDELHTLLPLIQEAGEAILRLQKKGFSIAKKGSHDIVTQADLLANDILKTKLMHTFPDYGWLSEESVDDAFRLTREYTWIVDPIDGTLEYATGVPEYAISVALVQKGLPVLSAVFNPAENTLFYAVKDQGAWLGDEKIKCHEQSDGKFLLLASRSEYKRGEWERFEMHHQVKPVGSIAYKLALIAAGRAHATFSLGPKSEWDIAAGVLLVSEAGGKVTNRQKEEFIFNNKAVRVNGIVATAASVNKQIFDLIGV